MGIEDAAKFISEDIVKRTDANKNKAEFKTLKEYADENPEDIDGLTNKIKTKEGLEFAKTMMDVKNYETPGQKRSGDLLADAVKKGLPVDRIDTSKPGAGNALSDLYQQEALRERDQKMSENATVLRKEFYAQKPVENFMLIKDQYNIMATALKESMSNPSSLVAIDQTLVTIFNKILDPTSVVRESEYARTGDNMGFVNALRGKADQIMKGGAGLTSIERKALVKIASQVTQSRQDMYKSLRDEYGYLSGEYKIRNPDMVIGRDQSIEIDVSDYIEDDTDFVKDDEGNDWKPVMKNGSVVGFAPAEKK